MILKVLQDLIINGFEAEEPNKQFGVKHSIQLCK